MILNQIYYKESKIRVEAIYKCFKIFHWILALEQHSFGCQKKKREENKKFVKNISQNFSYSSFYRSTGGLETKPRNKNNHA